MRGIKKKGFSCFKTTGAIRNNNHAKQTNQKTWQCGGTMIPVRWDDGRTLHERA